MSANVIVLPNRPRGRPFRTILHRLTEAPRGTPKVRGPVGTERREKRRGAGNIELCDLTDAELRLRPWIQRRPIPNGGPQRADDRGGAGPPSLRSDPSSSLVGVGFA